ncbi:branched-chain amino acid transport system ATP-binding protein [Rhodopseudomonas rhenobacensis]|uniref:Branched-chain amino acid transport system ATP-binding protein n=1 Tax=Rhodopseudomonas rhenobacensis TaxID=87461 RepID=A0A7W7Z760_9BRAD|nr:ABC transporter ATP-binding protein [Rhodopseudomonas rhenobacensis]MBB5049169.1 branched-chain amino acid transport system ATP-binding protein [Rhodopseudomonas rhenobacensis]
MLDLANLNVSYGKQKVLRDVTLSLQAREVVALIGSNAAGKSTALRTTAGLKKAESGTISFAGKDISALSTVDRVQSGLVLVPEGRQIFPRLSVEENLLMGAYHRADRNHLDGDLERIFAMFVRLKERRNQRAGSMSGGEQQMLAIGRGLMSRPKVMLLDEPTLGLAPIIIEELGSIVRGLAREGLAILLAEQNAMMALGCADRAYILQSGGIVMSGDAKQLSDTPEVKQMYLGT